jgi:hypothetical protein
VLAALDGFHRQFDDPLQRLVDVTGVGQRARHPGQLLGKGQGLAHDLCS